MKIETEMSLPFSTCPNWREVLILFSIYPGEVWWNEHRPRPTSVLVTRNNHTNVGHVVAFPMVHYVYACTVWRYPIWIRKRRFLHRCLDFRECHSYQQTFEFQTTCISIGDHIAHLSYSTAYRSVSFSFELTYNRWKDKDADHVTADRENSPQRQRHKMVCIWAHSLLFFEFSSGANRSADLSESRRAYRRW